jgi:hypothetical protein
MAKKTGMQDRKKDRSDEKDSKHTRGEQRKKKRKKKGRGASIGGKPRCRRMS